MTVKIIEKSEEKKSFPFTISNYTYKILLAKLVLIHGSSVASVYFQVSSNINNQEKSKSWQQGKCWKNPIRIAKEIGCNQRKVKEVLKILCQVELLELSYRGKLKMYKLTNHNISNLKELMIFLSDFDRKIINTVPKEKARESLHQLLNFNNAFNFRTPEMLTYLIKRTRINSIDFLKKALSDSEEIYKGSSLFCMNVLEIIFRNNKKNNEVLNTIQNIKDPIVFGCSNTTLNRYITSYEKNEFVNQLEDKMKELDLVYVENHDELNFNKGKVVNMSNKDFYCPICEKEFLNGRSLGMHLGKMKDNNHIVFNQLRRDNKAPYSTFEKLFNDHLHLFEIKTVSSETIVEQKVFRDEYMNIPCECKMSCRECHLNWKEVFYNDCNHVRKAAYRVEYGIDEKIIAENKKAKNKKEVDYEKIPTSKKPAGHGPDTAPGLLKYFYDLTQGRSPNFGKEVGQIKTQLNKGLTPDETRIVFDYMVKKGQIDLRFFSTSINEALLEQRYLKEMEQEGTAAFLLNYFYNSHGMNLNPQMFVREVQKIQETLNSGLSYQETKVVLDYMISQKCTIINFIASKRTEALSKYNNQSNVSNKTPFKSNPSFFDQDSLNIIRDDLAGGRTHLNKVDSKYKEQAINIAKEIFREKKFNQRYTSLEWAWRTGLELDKELFELGVKDSGKETYIDFALRNRDKLTPQKLEMLNKLKSSYEKWINLQKQNFNHNITTIK